MNVKYTAKYYKKGDMVFISHLDLMRLMRRGIRRTGLPFVLTGGFTPRVKISMPRALKLGSESEKEDVTLFFTEDRDPREVEESLNKEMPDGIGIYDVERAEK